MSTRIRRSHSPDDILGTHRPRGGGAGPFRRSGAAVVDLATVPQYWPQVETTTTSTATDHVGGASGPAPDRIVGGRGYGRGVGVPVERFEVRIPDEVLADLRARIRN